MSLARRSRILLACADGMDTTAVASKVGVNQATVGKWRRRFVAKRLDGLVDEPRPGAPRSITDDDVERVVVKTLEDKPLDATHWSTRDLARQVGMSAASVGRIWQAFGLRPWQTDTFKLSEDLLFIDKVRDIVGRYLNPPDKAFVLCVDEKTGIQALDRTQPILTVRLAQDHRREPRPPQRIFAANFRGRILVGGSRDRCSSRRDVRVDGRQERVGVSRA
jgi:transposase